MLDSLTSLLVLGLLGFAGWGTGAWLLTGSGTDARLKVGYPIAVGLAAWCFIGGVLNLLGWATVWSLLFLLGLGVSLGARECRRRMQVPETAPVPLSPRNLLPLLGLCVLLLVLAVFQMPSAIMNVGDDFETYLVRPVRMLATGSLTTDAFDGLGVDSLGGHFFLQGFLFTFLSLDYLAGFDHVFCLFVCVLLLWEIGQRLDTPKPWTGLAIAALLLIHPETANVSSVYSTTLLGLALVASLLQKPDEPVSVRRMILVPGLLLGALATLKTIAAFDAAFFGILLAIIRLAQRSNTRLWWREHLGIAAVSVAVMAPWILALHDRYLGIFLSDGSTSVYQPPEFVGTSEFSLIGYESLYYGGNLLCYNLIVVLLLAVMVLFVWSLRGNERAGFHVPVIAAAGAALATFLVNNLLFNQHTAIRYAIPLFLVGTTVAALVLGNAMIDRRVRVSGMVLIAAIVALSLQPFVQRAKKFAEWRTYLPYAVNESAAQHQATVLDPMTGIFFRTMQKRIPEESTVFTWIKLPFLLDYERNPIRLGNTHGMMAPWVHPPLSGNGEDLRQFLRRQGVEYVLFEREAVPPWEDPANQALLNSGNAAYHRMASYDIAIETALYDLVTKSRIVAEQERFVILQLATD